MDDLNDWIEPLGGHPQARTPHLPWYVPKKYFDMFPLDSIKLPKVLENDLNDVGDRVKDIAHRAGNYHKHVLEAGQWEEAVQGYLDSIAFSDAMLGRLLDALESSPYAKNTVVVIWSDHGWQLGEKEHWRKFALWENVLKSVLMIKAPKGTPGLPQGSLRGARCERNVSLQDIYPTLVEFSMMPILSKIVSLFSFKSFIFFLKQICSAGHRNI